MTTLSERYSTLCDALTSEGEPPVSTYWREGAVQFYAGTSLERIEMVGRGGDKSRDIVRSAITETLYGVFKVPTSERHYFCIVSENVSEATKTLRLIENYLRVLGVPFDATSDTIELRAMNRGIKVFACRIGAVSGFRCFGWAADEAAKWSDANGANPCKEVVASIRAMTVTHPKARGRMYSSPLARAGYFYERHSAGNTKRVLARQAATWIANDSVTEEQTRDLENDERIWMREYAAVPQSSALACFDADVIDRAFREPKAYATPRSRVMVIDASSGKKDAWTWCVAEDMYIGDAHGSYLNVSQVGGFEGRFYDDENAAEIIVSKLAAICEAQGITHVHGDQRESFLLKSAFHAWGLKFHEHAWGSGANAHNKSDAVERLRACFRDRTIKLCAHAKLREELLNFEEKITPSGSFTFGARGSGHDDFVALLVTLMMVQMDGGLRERKPSPPCPPVQPHIPQSWEGDQPYPRMVDVLSDHATSTFDHVDLAAWAARTGLLR